MKRLLLLFLCLLICCASFTAGAEQETEENWDNFFRSLEGHISFTLPCIPEITTTEDITANEALASGVKYVGWLNKRAFHCVTRDLGEWITIIADLSPMIECMKMDQPDREEADYQANALLNLAVLGLDMSEGEISEMPQAERLQRDDREYAILYFSIVFPDCVYVGKGIMEGTKAVLLMGEDGEEAQRLLNEMKVIADDEAQSFLNNRKEETVTVGSLTVVFPGPVDKMSDDESSSAECFGPEYSYLYLEFIPLNIMEEANLDSESKNILEKLSVRMALWKEMREAAQELSEIYVKNNVIKEAISVEQQGFSLRWLIKGVAPVSDYLDEDDVRPQNIYIYLTTDGIYTLEFPDNDTGRAFAESIEFAE